MNPQRTRRDRTTRWLRGAWPTSAIIKRVRGVIAFVITLSMASSLLAGSVPGLSVTDVEAVDSGRDALGGRVTFPWYDPAEDSLRPIVVTPHREVDAENRASDWENTWSLPQTPNFSFLNWLWKALFYVFMALLILVPIVVLLLVIWALINADTGPLASPGRSAKDQLRVGDIERVENLPFELRVPRGDLLSEAQRLYEAGNYREAILYLFSHQLLFLDRHHLIRLTKGKTNRQYLREVRRKIPIVMQPVERTMIAFEDVFFGDHSLDKQRFESCYNELDAFHQHVEEASA